MFGGKIVCVCGYGEVRERMLPLFMSVSFWCVCVCRLVKAVAPP